MKANKAQVQHQSPRGHGEKLSRRQDTAIIALVAQPTIAKAAEAAQVGEATLWRWMQIDSFRKRLQEAQDKVFDGALGALQSASVAAVECLRRNLSSGTPSSEVRAAEVIVSHTIKAREIFQLQTRIEQLEAALKAREEAEQLGEDGDADDHVV